MGREGRQQRTACHRHVRVAWALWRFVRQAAQNHCDGQHDQPCLARVEDTPRVRTQRRREECPSLVFSFGRPEPIEVALDALRQYVDGCTDVDTADDPVVHEERHSQARAHALEGAEQVVRGPVAVERRKAPVEVATLWERRLLELLWERRRRRGEHVRDPVALLGRSALSYRGWAARRGSGARQRLVSKSQRGGEERREISFAATRCGGRTDLGAGEAVWWRSQCALAATVCAEREARVVARACAEALSSHKSSREPSGISFFIAFFANETWVSSKGRLAFFVMLACVKPSILFKELAAAPLAVPGWNEYRLSDVYRQCCNGTQSGLGSGLGNRTAKLWPESVGARYVSRSRMREDFDAMFMAISEEPVPVRHWCTMHVRIGDVIDLDDSHSVDDMLAHQVNFSYYTLSGSGMHQVSYPYVRPTSCTPPRLRPPPPTSPRHRPLCVAVCIRCVCACVCSASA